MNRAILTALLAIPVLAAGIGGAAARDDNVGDYYFKNTNKGRHTDAQLRSVSKRCFTRLGYRDLASNMPAITADPAYQSCMRASGWQLVYTTPPRRPAYAGHGHHGGGYSSFPDTSDNGAAQRAIDDANAMNASNAQNAAAQAQNDAANAAAIQTMNQNQ